LLAIRHYSRHTESFSIQGVALLSTHPMLQVQDVCKTFDGGHGALEVLRNLRFNVATGEFISIIGPSGCGKTTLLRILHGLEPTTSGAVSVSGKHVEAPSPSSAIVFQQFNLFPWLTVARNVAFGLEFHNLVIFRLISFLRIPCRCESRMPQKAEAILCHRLMVGWGAWIRIRGWRNQNQTSSLVRSTRILKKSENSSLG
jgi:ABC-type sugar transport system ATPase subunit